MATHYRVKQWADLHCAPTEGEWVIYTDDSPQILHLYCTHEEAKDFWFMLNKSSVERQILDGKELVL